MECQLLYMQNLIIMGENIKIDNKEIKLYLNLNIKMELLRYL